MVLKAELTLGEGKTPGVFRAQALWCLGFVETTEEELRQGILNSLSRFRGEKENSGDTVPTCSSCGCWWLQTGKQLSWDIMPQRLDAR